MSAATPASVSFRFVCLFFCQVGIAKEKVVNISRLSELAAAELFVASAPREVCRNNVDLYGSRVYVPARTGPRPAVERVSAYFDYKSNCGAI